METDQKILREAVQGSVSGFESFVKRPSKKIGRGGSVRGHAQKDLKKEVNRVRFLQK